MTIDNGLSQTIDAYVQAWNAMDFESLADLWHQHEDGLYYVAEEIDSPLRTFSQIQDYWSMTKDAVEWVNISVSDQHHKELGNNFSVASFEMHVDMCLRNNKSQPAEPLGTDVRVSAIFRKADADWKFIHYVEAPLGTLPFIRRVYNANVRNN